MERKEFKTHRVNISTEDFVSIMGIKGNLVSVRISWTTDTVNIESEEK